MKIVRRNTERFHLHRVSQDIWQTFYPADNKGDTPANFGVLAAFNEMRLPPGTVSALNSKPGAETITYVYRGTLAQEDSTGNSNVVHTGEFQRMIVGCGIRHKETNPSHTGEAHIFRISLLPPQAGLGSVQEQMRFPVALRHNMLCAIASPDGRKNSLRILQDAIIYSSVLDPGYHLVHELLPGRGAWLHVVYGVAVMQDKILAEGDGVGVRSEPSVSITAQEDTEILLVDLGVARQPFSGQAR
jgi:redox-sensitive bicupin YhaK (pirin superfamily)